MGLVILLWIVMGGVHLLQEKKYTLAALTGIGGAFLLIYWFGLLAKWAKTLPPSVETGDVPKPVPQDEKTEALANQLDAFKSGEIHPLEGAMTMAAIDSEMMEPETLLWAIKSSDLSALVEIKHGQQELIILPPGKSGVAFASAFTTEALAVQSGFLTPKVRTHNLPMTELLEWLPPDTALFINSPATPVIHTKFMPEQIVHLKWALKKVSNSQAARAKAGEN